MNNKDYQKKIDEHRQSIEIDESEIRLSRTKRRRNRKKETPLLTTLTFILIGIPLVILIYVWGLLEGGTRGSSNCWGKGRRVLD